MLSPNPQPGQDGTAGCSVLLPRFPRNHLPAGSISSRGNPRSTPQNLCHYIARLIQLSHGPIGSEDSSIDNWRQKTIGLGGADDDDSLSSASSISFVRFHGGDLGRVLASTFRFFRCRTCARFVSRVSAIAPGSNSSPRSPHTQATRLSGQSRVAL